MDGKYLNSSGYEVPENKIVVVPFGIGGDGYYKDIVEPLKGKTQRDWFNPHYYYCLPINIGNQYGFLIKSQRNFEMIWDGTANNPFDVTITFLDEEGSEKQDIKNGFGNGVVTVQNYFFFKTPPGINLMTIQPPNMFLPACSAMTGVVECDNIRRDFTFNFKITVPNYKITVKKGDPLGAFIPIPRYFVDNFSLSLISDYFDNEVHSNELNELQKLSNERINEDVSKTHQSGRRYFNGEHTDGTQYPDHQKRMK